MVLGLGLLRRRRARGERDEKGGHGHGHERDGRQASTCSLPCEGWEFSSTPTKTLVRRREPIWLSANRVLGQHMQRISRRLASVSADVATGGKKSSAQHAALPRPGDPALVKIPDRDLICERLRDVPVYTITSNENFVLLQEEEGSKGQKAKSLLMLFMSANDAKEFKNDVVSKQAVLKPTIGTLFMDKVFKLHMQSRPKQLEDVALRLMPDRKQVAHAFDTYNGMGLGQQLKALPGVPLFQAEGLTMKNGDKTMIPLFFGKEELDFALEQAFGKSAVTPAVQFKRQWFSRQKERVKEVAKSPFPFLYHSIWREDDDKAKQRLKELETKQTTLLEKQPKIQKPKVQVGSFEDVLFRMLYEKGKEWDNVMFVPQGVNFK